MICCTITVPPRGVSEGWDERNGNMGRLWASLNPDEKEVFSARIFQHYSKIPCGDSDMDKNKETNLSPEEDKLYRPLHERLVNHEKVDLVLEKGSEGQGQNTSQSYKKALKNLQNINLEVRDFS
jgi:hypothetical protein